MKRMRASCLAWIRCWVSIPLVLTPTSKMHSTREASPSQPFRPRGRRRFQDPTESLFCGSCPTVSSMLKLLLPAFFGPSWQRRGWRACHSLAPTISPATPILQRLPFSSDYHSLAPPILQRLPFLQRFPFSSAYYSPASPILQRLPLLQSWCKH